MVAKSQRFQFSLERRRSLFYGIIDPDKVKTQSRANRQAAVPFMRAIRSE